VIIARLADFFWMLPPVYLPIFVPPQNRIPDPFSDFIVNEHLLTPFVLCDGVTT
jgi:hypothetical protein